MPEKIYEAYGVCFALRASSEANLQELESLTPVGSSPFPEGQPLLVFSLEEDGRGFWVVANGNHRDGPYLFQKSALEQLAKRMELAVGLRSPSFIFVHAGVVTWQGKGWMFPGVSFCGKSTLVQEMVNDGAVFYSDEFALVDSKGLVHPYTREIRLRDGEPNQPKRIGTEPMAIDFVLGLEYRQQGTLELKEIESRDLCLLLLQNSIPARFRPKESMEHLSALAKRARGFTGARGEAHDTLLDLKEALESLLASRLVR